MNPSDYRDRQRNFINAAEARLRQQFKAQVKTDAFMLVLMAITTDVIKLAQPIIQAGGAVTEEKRQDLKEHVLKWTMDRLQGINKEDLRLIAGVHLAKSIMDEIEANPWGTTPDPLSPG